MIIFFDLHTYVQDSQYTKDLGWLGFASHSDFGDTVPALHTYIHRIRQQPAISFRSSSTTVVVCNDLGWLEFARTSYYLVIIILI